ncbi:hypothetical protein [Tardiphaga sp. OK245]|uniref:hypothetical protein n=1 Tax=Tardiphaga sp. OK245 TaxID=1855306 RepID=UPI0008A8151F|nr:hypothetical protein [Tardiphaga sp. OK245]SEI19578.1 hypothetical protein SAMN05216367_4906 [Tardiphaga sp. OK245]
MTHFHIRFLKKICNDTGHECVTCQGEFLVENTSAGLALEEAEAAFCELRKTDRWDMFADTAEIRITGGREGFAPRLAGVGHPKSQAI